MLNDNPPTTPSLTKPHFWTPNLIYEQLHIFKVLQAVVPPIKYVRLEGLLYFHNLHFGIHLTPDTQLQPLQKPISLNTVVSPFLFCKA